MKSLTIAMREPVQAHKALGNELWPWMKPILIAGHPVTVKAVVQEDDRTLFQNRYYWSQGCLGAISDQAKVCGIQYEASAWHNLFKRKFLGMEIIKEKVAGSKRTHIIRRLRSTSDLKLRAMNVYLEEVQAYAATELNVTFECNNWQEWVDPETGEVFSQTERKKCLNQTAG